MQHVRGNVWMHRGFHDHVYTSHMYIAQFQNWSTYLEFNPTIKKQKKKTNKQTHLTFWVYMNKRGLSIFYTNLYQFIYFEMFLDCLLAWLHELFVHHVYAITMGNRRGCQISWDCCYKWWATMWVLRIKTRYSGKAVTSPVPSSPILRNVSSLLRTPYIITLQETANWPVLHKK